MIDRYETESEESCIVNHVHTLFDNNPTARDLDVSACEWERDTVLVDNIDTESEDHPEQSNVALRERRQAVEKAQLTVGEGNPLVVVGEENTLIEGYTRLQMVINHFGEEQVPVYRAYPLAKATSPSQTTAISG